MKTTILTRKEAEKRDWRYIYCQNKKNLFFILSKGWVGFRTKKEAKEYLNYLESNK